MALGRPRKSVDFLLEFEVLETHERLRSSEGLGRNAAIIKTVAEVKARHPGCTLSQTTVKKILAELQPESQPKDFPLSFQVGALGNWKQGVFRVVKHGNTYALTFGDRPSYPKRGQHKKRNFGKLDFSRKRS